MENELKQSLKKTFGAARGKTALRVLAAVFAAVFLAGVVLLALGWGESRRMEAETFTGIEEQGYVQLTAVGLSESFAYMENGTEEYYFAVDTDGYISVVMIKGKPGQAVQELIDFTYDEREEAAPVVFRGKAEKIPADLRALVPSAYNKIFATDLLTADNMDTYVGAWYLDSSVSATDFSGMFSIGLVFALCGGLLALVFGGSVLSDDLRRRRFWKKMTDADCLAVQRALENGQRIEDLPVVLGEDMLVTNSPCLFTRYRDIAWVYRVVQRTNFVQTGNQVMLGLRDGTKQVLLSTGAGKKQQARLEKLLLALAARLPQDTMLGYSKENQKQFKEMGREKR